jgi:hypothetical protein
MLIPSPRRACSWDSGIRPTTALQFIVSHEAGGKLPRQPPANGPVPRALWRHARTPVLLPLGKMSPLGRLAITSKQSYAEDAQDRERK